MARNQEEVLDHRSLQHVYKSCIDLNEEEETALQALGVAVGSKTDKVAPQPFFFRRKQKRRLIPVKY